MCSFHRSAFKPDNWNSNHLILISNNIFGAQIFVCVPGEGTRAMQTMVEALGIKFEEKNPIKLRANLFIHAHIHAHLKRTHTYMKRIYFDRYWRRTFIKCHGVFGWIRNCRSAQTDQRTKSVSMSADVVWNMPANGFFPVQPILFIKTITPK